MHLRAPAILLAARPHGETAVVARMLTSEFGMVAGYVAGGRGRRLRPVVIPGNLVELQLSARSDSQLPFARLELTESRGPWLGEPLAAAAIGWVCALTATALPERQPYPTLYDALGGLLDAICHAPSARGWAGALAGYETLLLRELGYGGGETLPAGGFEDALAAMDRLAAPLDHYLLADRRGDVMAARARLRELLGRMVK
jgi:DNA repair protein RecO (recombination protein O)